jgi:phage terminase large subunit-like protein
MARAATSRSDPTTRFARDVVAGKVVAGDLMRRACRRHLDDLETGHERGLVWRPDKARHALEFFPSVLSVTAGAMAGKPFELPSYTAFVVGSLFGWHRGNRDRGNGPELRRFRTAWIETGKGQIKALALDTPIATPSGWTTMGELKAGDQVFDERGVPCNVIGAHEIRDDGECYAVRLDDGSEITAEAGHLWQTEMRKSGSADHGAATRGVPLAERGGWRNGLHTTAEIAATLRYKNGNYQSINHSIPLTGPLDLPSADLPAPPYVLGCWLGDGDSDTLRITVGDHDHEILRHLQDERIRVGERRGGHQHAGRYQLSWPNDYSGQRTGSLASRFRSLNVIGNKHIPAIYLRASRDQRLALLQGLMDTDGTIAHDGQCAISSKWLRLAENIRDLAISLGLKATLNSGASKISGRYVGLYHRVVFYAPETLPVFRLKRKVVRQASRHDRRRLSGDHRIVACERVPTVPVRCISVDSPSQMFLAGRSLVPTHNSPLLAALGLYLIGFCDIPRAEAYAIAKDRFQANVLFQDAVAMCRAPIPGERTSLEDRGVIVIRGFGNNAWRLEHIASGSKFQALAGDEAVAGPRPVYVAADEIHEWKSGKPLEDWKAALAKMPGDSLLAMGTNTPAADQVLGTDLSEHYQRILRGEFAEDASFVLIARTDPDDDPMNDETCWPKALPCLGLTYPIENVRDRVVASRNRVADALATKRLYFGIPVGTSEYWIDLDAWEAVQGRVDWQAMRGYPCFLGMDLALKNDLTALAACWQIDDDRLAVAVLYWKPRDGDGGLVAASRTDGASYVDWAEQGLITAIPGRSIEYEFVAAEVERVVATQDVVMMAFDPAHSGEFRKACDRIGFQTWVYDEKETSGTGLQMRIHGQGKYGMNSKNILWMPRSLQILEDKILAGEIVIDENPVTKWCSGNAAVEPDAQGNRWFSKKRSRGRIDGLSAMAMAVGAATHVDTSPKLELAAMIF